MKILQINCYRSYRIEDMALATARQNDLSVMNEGAKPTFVSDNYSRFNTCN